MKKINLIQLTLFIFLLGTLPLFAQITRDLGKAKDPIDIKAEKAKVLTLGCCKCLEGSNSLDLSTIAGNAWTLNGNPVSIVSPRHPSWDKNTGGANWVSSTTTWGTNIPAGDYDYKLAFSIPNCTISQEIRLTGDVGADNNFKVFVNNLDTNQMTLISTCTGNVCFKNSTNIPSFSTTLGPGNYNLVIRVNNQSGPSGMSVNAKLVSKCSTSLTKEETKRNK